MKRYTIPLICKTFTVYSGDEEWQKFRAITIKEGADEPEKEKCPPKGSGRCFAGYVWVHDLKDKKILIHELSHLIDDVMLTIGSHDTEFRAYITEWIFYTCLKE